MVAAVMWKLSGEEAFMTVVSLPPVSPTPADVADYLAGVYNRVHSPENQVSRRDDPRLAHDRILVGGTPAVRYITDIEGGGRMLAYLLMGARRAYAFGFAIQTADDTRVRALAAELMAAIRLPARRAESPHPAYQLGSFIGAFIMTGILSRIIWRRYRRTFKGAFVAFGVAGGIPLVGSLWMGAGALFYPLAAFLWLVLDLLRSELAGPGPKVATDERNTVDPGTA
jgi:hypothetical protein